MPISITSAFSDPGDFQRALRRCGVLQLFPKDSAGFRAGLTDIRLSRLELLAGRERVSRVATVAVPLGQVLIEFPNTREGAHYWGERQISLGELVVISGTLHRTWRICGPTRWGAILMPVEALAGYVHTIIGEHGPIPAAGLTYWRPSGPVFRELLKLYRAAVHHTVHQPEAPVERESAHGLEQQLVTSLIETLTDMPSRFT